MRSLTSLRSISVRLGGVAVFAWVLYTISGQTGTGTLRVEMAIPVLIALVPVLLPTWWVRIVAGLILAAFVVVGGFSIGLFYAPSAAIMLFAGLLSGPVRNR